MPGEILVAPSTDPAWTPLFLRAAALVTESSGYLSHGAIVAREYGLPAVVNVPGVMKLIKDGELLEVNGDDGTVTIDSKVVEKLAAKSLLGGRLRKGARKQANTFPG